MMYEALEGKVVRAIDVGYGNVKFSFNHLDAFSKVECEIFPSRSPVAGDKSLSAGLVQGRDTVIINVRGTDYEVGKGVAKAQGTFDESSVLDRVFCLSDSYLARLRGALYYMMGADKKTNAPYINGGHIALLVVGLPVSTFRNKELPVKLKEVLTGPHELPDGRSVIVDNVLVMPQPLGAFFEYAFENGMFETMSEQKNLIIDPGFFTFDWLLSDGLTIIDKRSDSVNRGMSAVIKEIVEAAKKKYKWDAETGMLMRMLDDHFRDGFEAGKPFVVYQDQIDVKGLLIAGKSVINEAVSALVNNVGDGADIQNIILAGGGAQLYHTAIQEKFPRHKILVMGNPVYSNVRGFQLAGEQRVIQRLRNARKSSTEKAASITG
jgi:plasmid segregation protein ParM